MGDVNQSIASEFNYFFDATKYATAPKQAERIELPDTEKALKE